MDYTLDWATTDNNTSVARQRKLDIVYPPHKLFTKQKRYPVYFRPFEMLFIGRSKQVTGKRTKYSSGNAVQSWHVQGLNYQCVIKFVVFNLHFSDCSSLLFSTFKRKIQTIHLFHWKKISSIFGSITLCLCKVWHLNWRTRC